MKTFASKSAQLLLKTFAIYLALCMLLLILPTRWTMSIRSTLFYPVSLLQRAALKSFLPAETAVRRFAGSVNASEEASELRAQNALLRAQLAQEVERRYRAEQLLSQITQLPPDAQAKSVTAALVGYDPAASRSTATFDKGSDAGVRLDSAVLWNGAFIGRVAAVDANTCRAILIGDRNCHVGVRCERTRVHGSLGAAGGVAVINYIEASADVRAGDTFVTSGIDGAFPPGLLVGECTESSSATGEIFRYVRLKPAFTPSQIEHVVILLP